MTTDTSTSRTASIPLVLSRGFWASVGSDLPWTSDLSHKRTPVTDSLAVQNRYLHETHAGLIFSAVITVLAVLLMLLILPFLGSYYALAFALGYLGFLTLAAVVSQWIPATSVPDAVDEN